MGNAVSGAITIMITTHPFVPNFAGEVDFSPDKLGPVTTFRAHSGMDLKVQLALASDKNINFHSTLRVDYETHCVYDIQYSATGGSAYADKVSKSFVLISVWN